MIVKDRFVGKVAIVTGGYQGMGECISKRFIEEGGKVCFCGRSAEKVAAMQEVLGENALGVVCDITNEEQVKAMVAAAEEKFGKIDVLFNNAGIIGRSKFLEMPMEELDRIMATNVKGTALVTQVVAKSMIAHNIAGAVVCTGSINSMIASPYIPAYCASKGAVNMLAKAMSVDLGPYNIRVNCYGPASSNTPMTIDTRTSNPEKVKLLSSKLSIKRWAEPEEMAAVALFLASDDASYMTGAFVPVDAGTTAMTGPAF